MKRKVAIQGIVGSNHHQVATDYFGADIALSECLSFDVLVEQLLNGSVDEAVMAIENSIAGSIIPNYNLVCQHGLQIVGEHYLGIQHNLMVLPGVAIEDVKEVRSHPMALLQCKDFLRQYRHIKLVEDADTAETARQIQEKQLKQVAAIAPKVAAELYGLAIIAENIQTIKNNATRFIILQKQGEDPINEGVTKASLRFITDHKRGSLAAVLNVMSDCNLNLTKIQSLPVIETPWKYAFFVDVTFETYASFKKAKALLEIMSDDFTVLGEYKNALLS